MSEYRAVKNSRGEAKRTGFTHKYVKDTPALKAKDTARQKAEAAKREIDPVKFAQGLRDGLQQPK